MPCPRRVGPALLVCLLLLAAANARAGEPEVPPASYGDTYTAAELEALDRALHAVNMTRTDLTFRKDMARGHECLDVVRAMLHDPLRIAPETDALVREAHAVDEAFHPPLGGLVAAHDRLPGRGLPLGTSVTDEPFQLLRGLVREQGRLHPLPTEPKPEALLAFLEHLVSTGGNPLHLGPAEGAPEGTAFEPVGFDDLRYRALRRHLPEQMAWHEVFASPYPPEVDGAIETEAKAHGEAWIHELAARVSGANMVEHWLVTFGDPVAWLGELPAAAFPQDAPLVRETPYGRVALGTPKDDVWEGDFAALIDPGGNDRYVGCRLGTAYGTENRRAGFFADLGGDDVYACGEVDVTLGAALLGIAAFLDLGAGNDRYVAGHASLGAAMGGVAAFLDDGGTDVYEGRTFTQGAAGFGVAVFQDDSVQPAPALTSDEGTKDPVEIRLFDNDRLHAWANAQAFARCLGVALCVNRRGNEVYEAGGVYLHAPLFADRYQSFSQGFAIGERGIDRAGGIALLVDHGGNDRYLGDVYNQGVGYWYAAGLLWDGGGNDTYEMTQYGQGSGIHLAVGGLVDVAGNDTYVMHSGLGQGGSHDYAASVLHDRGGSDHYMGMTSCNGCGLTNSVGLHFDRAGDDTYAGRRNGGVNTGRPARDFGSIGVLLDLAGQDDYLGVMRDDTLWRQTEVGVGWDRAVPAQEQPAAVEQPAEPGRATATMPAVCTYEGDLTPAVFDELWAIAVRWEVGDNRSIVPVARQRLAAFGPAVLPLMDAKVEKSESGLELRAFQDVLAQLRAGGAETPVTDFLRANLAQASERRRRIALQLIGELKVEALGEAVVGVLRGEDEPLARRAAATLALLRSHAGDDTLTAWLDPAGDERRIQAALRTLLAGETECWPALLLLLDHPLPSVRTMLAQLLVRHAGAFAPALRRALRDGALGGRSRRTVLDVLARADVAPEREDVAAALALLDDADWGMRADAARVLRHWQGLGGADGEVLAPAGARLERLREEDEDPYVRFCAAPPP